MSTQVELHTSHGLIRVELAETEAPLSSANFLEYVRSGHYDGTIFHRIIKGFMVQGGGFDADMKQKPTRDQIPNEADNGLKNDHYTLAMARTSVPDSATAQFFINATDNDFLNHTAKTSSGWGYAVFGKVVEGTEVVDAMEKAKTGRKNGMADVPVEDVIINRAVVVE